MLYIIYLFLIIIYYWGKIFNFLLCCFIYFNDGVCVDFGICGVLVRVLVIYGDLLC